MNENVEAMPITVPVDAPYEDIVQALERLCRFVDRNRYTFQFAVEYSRQEIILRPITEDSATSPWALYVSKIDVLSLRHDPRGFAEDEARELIQMLESCGWRSPSPLKVDPGMFTKAQRIAEKARRLNPDNWPGWSTSEKIVAALATGELAYLPSPYKEPEVAWSRIDVNQRAVVQSVNPDTARYCEERQEQET
jgi:hypothetical protein